ncbi:conserved hypothetical protein [Catenulispora acidiphila DSM 44928]|uniref:Uncharacterized protein n=1 Tax=Catenulispora acidiphila (strain DSM 44928 / JCM 14897 / NBRC 102108 / NRRL B-24433 / ID139908) TaxID=479433 RepID=C7Q1C0_CATAD|nr:SCO2521 family protein [Catenulispora acidiphila]ACU73649.1 conserved hypothetical protein [Catenulispora acidiphila DSM 44928]
MARSGAPLDPPARHSPAVVLGVVVTNLLNTSGPLPLDAARQALKLLPGVGAATRRYPEDQVVSPDLFYGVDCALATSRTQPRVVGTVRARALLTAGHVLQGSARVDVVLDASTRRMPWSYYAARTGTVEAVNKADPADLVAGFLTTESGAGLLDLAGIGAHIMSRLDAVPQVDRRARMRTEAGRLRWAVLVRDDAEMQAEVVAGEDGGFRVRMTAPTALLPSIVEFCETLALHHWLLAALKNAFDRSGRAPRPIDELGPALSYLGHMWNPTAYLSEPTQWIWKALERDAQLSRGWQSTLTRVRDEVSLLTLKAIDGTLHKEFA